MQRIQVQVAWHRLRRAFSRLALEPSCQRNDALSIARAIRVQVRNSRFDEGYQLFTNYAARSKGSRFLAHVLLHALCRHERPFLASTFAKLCLDNGLKIRRSTFDKVFAGVSPPFNPALLVNPTGTSVPPLSPSLTAAITLLKAAHRNNHKHSAWMFDRLINALLLQGEVLTATLLFITLIKEWNTRYKNGEPNTRHPNRPSSSVLPHVDNPLSIQTRAQHPHSGMMPADKWMHQIVDAIEKLNKRSIGKKNDASFTTSVTALTSLVALLREDDTFIPARRRVLRAMYLIPFDQARTDAVFDSWHAELLEMCQQPYNFGRIDLSSYHELLVYALRERMSLDLAITVLHELCLRHRPTIQTYNTLLRELGRVGQHNAMYEILHLLDVAYPGTLIKHSTPTSLSSVEKPCEKMVSSLTKHPIPPPNEYTLISSMSLAVSRGQAREACLLVSKLFPVLGSTAQRETHVHGQTYTLTRVRKMSPHFWAIAIHAAAADNHLPFSLRIWNLLEKAEYGRDGGRSAFTLEAFTSQFQLFFRRLWRLHKTIQTIQDTQDRTSVWGLFMQYNYILATIQRVLRLLARYPVSSSQRKKRESKLKGRRPMRSQHSTRRRTTQQEPSTVAYHPSKPKTAPKIPVDEKFVKIIFSIAECIQSIEKRLPVLAYRVSKQEQRVHYFVTPTYRYRAYRTCRLIQRIFWGYRALAPRGILRAADPVHRSELKPAILGSKRGIPYAMRVAGVVKKTRFGFKVVYCGRTFRYGRKIQGGKQIQRRARREVANEAKKEKGISALLHTIKIGRTQ